MSQRKKYGIWGGRFQIVHRGHEYILKYVSSNYSNVCIGIVNPNPNKPAWNVAEHEKFDPRKNPFTYFERLYLWSMLLRENSIDAVIVPHWHPRKSLKLEKTFLPAIVSDREWVIPRLDGEEFKIEDFQNAGENVYVLDDLPPELKQIHASDIRVRFDNNDRFFKEDIPSCIQEITEAFLKRRDVKKDFVIVPISGDNLHASLFCHSINISFDENKTIIFAPIVNVKNFDEWWKCDPVEDEDSFFSFYRKSEIINSIMRQLHFYDFCTIPLIVRNGAIQDIDAYFPSQSRRSWLIIKNINSSTAIKQILKSERIIIIDQTNCNAISNDYFLEVSLLLFGAFQEKRKLLSLI